MGVLNEWLDRTRGQVAPPELEPATPPPVRPTPESDAVHLIALLGEGVNPLLINGTLYLTGNVSTKATAIFAQHGAAITRLVAAMTAGRVDRRQLAAKMADFEGWKWPGTADAPARWPGRNAFLLGVEPVRCSDCARFDGRACGWYGRMQPQLRPVRCLWALPPRPC